MSRWSDLDDRDAEGRFRYGLASIGLADDVSEGADDDTPTDDGDTQGCHPGPGAVVSDVVAEGVGRPDDAADRRYGDRVVDWVRPQYRELPEPAGAYWTPPPEAAPYAGPYGWPVPVERLPAAPDYEPATGLDLVPAGEPTAVVPQWPAGTEGERFGVSAEGQWPPAGPEEQRFGVSAEEQWPPAGPGDQRFAASLAPAHGEWPAHEEEPQGRQWPPTSREQQRTWAEIGEEERRPRRRVVMIRRGRAEARRSEPAQALPLVEDEAKDQRPRPRPRPRPSTVYVSRHAAE